MGDLCHYRRPYEAGVRGVALERWRGSCGIFCLVCEVLRKYPSVTSGASSPFRGAYIPKGEPECKKPPLKGEGDRRRRWRGSFGIFYVMCEVLRKYPSVKPAACQLPFQGSLYTKREPECKKPPLKGEGDRRRRWRGSCGIFYVMCEVLRKYPSVTCGASSTKGEPRYKRASPLGEGNRRRRWRGSREIFCLV